MGKITMDFQALEANYRPFELGDGVEQAPRKKKKSFWIDQISTAGGILGGVGGSFIAPLAGTAAGAGAGSALGETLENALTGESLGKNVIEEGALGAVFGAGPLRLGRAALGARTAAKAGAGLSQALKQGAQEGAEFTLRGALGKSANKKATQMATKQFGLQGGFISKFQKRFGEDAGETITRYGVGSADDITEQATKQQKVFDELVKNTDTVKKSTVQKKLTTIAEALSKEGPSEQKALAKKLKAETSQLLKKYGDEIPASELNTIRGQYDNFVNYSMKQSDPRSYSLNKRIADTLRKTIQEASGSDQLKQTGLEISKLRSLAEEVATRAPTVANRNASPLGLRNLLGAGIGGGLGFGAGGPMGAVAGAALTSALNSPTGRKLAATGAKKVAGSVTRSGAKASQNAFSHGEIAKRVGGIGATRGLVAGSVPDVSEEKQSPATIDGALAQSQKGFSGGMVAPADQNPYSRENLMADVQRDPKNAADYFELYQMYDEVFGAPETVPLTGEAQKRALTAQSGLRSLGTLEDALSTDPGAFQRQALPNPLGITGRLTGTTDIRAATDNVVDVIARLRSGAAITDEEAARFARFLPLPGDSQEDALIKLQSVRAELESFMQSPSRGSSLEDALMSLQGAY